MPESYRPQYLRRAGYHKWFYLFSMKSRIRILQGTNRGTRWKKSAYRIYTGKIRKSNAIRQRVMDIGAAIQSVGSFAVSPRLWMDDWSIYRLKEARVLKLPGCYYVPRVCILSPGTILEMRSRVTRLSTCVTRGRAITPVIKKVFWHHNFWTYPEVMVEFDDHCWAEECICTSGQPLR